MSGDAELRCIELATGKVRWIALPKLNDDAAGRGSLIHVDGHFLYLTEEGWLYLLKPNTERYEQLAVWDASAARREEQHLSNPDWVAPVVSHGLLYVRGKGQLMCVEVIGE